MIVRVRVVGCDAGLAGRAKVLDQRAAAARALSALGLVDPPRIPDGPPLPAQGTHWSVSHTQGAAGAAVAPFALGFDLERARELRPELVRRFLSPAEPALDPLVAWTAKEAVLKKLGLGMAGLSRCAIVARESNERLQLRFEDTRHDVLLQRNGVYYAALSHDGGPATAVQWEWET
ncbi:MAG: 4'-phosphopantetheinyl transferase superfamily protein [Planctomycetes bacterium]|nr:4'-phosphopantetheinyl transferase superfamily protein [Planctomycetota bacterium]